MAGCRERGVQGIGKHVALDHDASFMLHMSERDRGDGGGVEVRILKPPVDNDGSERSMVGGLCTNRRRMRPM